MSTTLKTVKRVTTHTLLEMKASGQKIAMLTAYDYSLARLVDTAGIDVILVGDSASNVMAGHEPRAATGAPFGATAISGCGAAAP